MNCSARDTWRIEKQCLRDLNPVFLTCRLPNHHEPSETLREEEGKWKNASRFAQPPPGPPPPRSFLAEEMTTPVVSNCPAPRVSLVWMVLI